MREFKDHEGRTWVAVVAGGEGGDYKGRYHFSARLVDESIQDPSAAVVALQDVRWNSRLAAERTLAGMSDVELRRRLRSAVGRAPQHAN